jgi:hypothetical protein
MHHGKKVKVSAKKYLIVPENVHRISLYMISLPNRGPNKGSKAKRKHFWEDKTIMSRPHVIGDLEVAEPRIKFKNVKIVNRNEETIQDLYLIKDHVAELQLDFGCRGKKGSTYIELILPIKYFRPVSIFFEKKCSKQISSKSIQFQTL